MKSNLYKLRVFAFAVLAVFLTIGNAFSQITGSVTNVETNAPLNGVLVTTIGGQTITAGLGAYTLNVPAGTYELTFQAVGYQSETITAVSPSTLNVTLTKAAYAPTNVVAAVNEDDTEVLVTWGNAVGPYEIMYDDGFAENMAGWELPGNMNAVKFTPATYPTTVTGGRFYIGNGTFPQFNSGLVGLTFRALVLDDVNGLPGAILGSTTVTVTNLGWMTASGFDVEITEGDFYIAMEQLTQQPNAVPIGVDETNSKAFRSYSRFVTAGGSWAVSPYQDFMIRAVVEGTPASVVVAERTKSKLITTSSINGMISRFPERSFSVESGYEGDATYQSLVENTRELVGYNIYRANDIDPESEPDSWTNIVTLAENVTGNEYTDMTWAALPAGWYAYGVTTVYSSGEESEVTVSNIVSHLLDAEVTINVSTTNDADATGATVILTGLDFPNYIDTLNVANGQVVFPEVMHGNYTVTVSLAGFINYVVNADVQEDVTINIILEENRYVPTNLVVDPITLVATWDVPEFTGEDPEMGYGIFLNGVLVANTPSTTYTYTNLVYGQTYMAGVAGLYSSGYSDLETFQFTSEYLPAPNNLVGVITEGTNDVVLTWTVPLGTTTGLTGYNVYRDDVLLGNVTVPTLTLTDSDLVSGTYEYTVTAVYDLTALGSTGTGESEPEGPVTIEIAQVCEAPTGLVATINGLEGINLVWVAPTTAVTGYIVYRDGVMIDSTTALTFEDTPLVAIEEEICYTVTSYFDGATAIQDCESVPSAPACVTVDPTLVLPAPNNLVGVNVANTYNAQLTWAVPTGTTTGLTGYNVYKDDVLLVNVPVTTLEYFDNNLALGTYEYHVTAVYDLTAYELTGTAESEIEGPVTVVIGPVCVTPTTLVATVSALYGDQIELTWVAPSIAPTGYNIYRDGVQINTTTGLTYLDTDPAISILNEEFCYTVTSYTEGVVAADDCESAPSTEACVIVTASDDLDLNVIKMYPNPSNNLINIQLTNNIKQFVVYNYLGQVVESQVVVKENARLNVNDYKAGGYVIKFITKSGESFTKKIVVTK